MTKRIGALPMLFEIPHNLFSLLVALAGSSDIVFCPPKTVWNGYPKLIRSNPPLLAENPKEAKRLLFSFTSYFLFYGFTCSKNSLVLAV